MSIKLESEWRKNRCVDFIILHDRKIAVLLKGVQHDAVRRELENFVAYDNGELYDEEAMFEYRREERQEILAKVKEAFLDVKRNSIISDEVAERFEEELEKLDGGNSCV